MTPKELLYVTDALGHQQQMKTACCDFSNQLQDQELKTFVSSLSTKHQECFGKFFQLL